MTYERFHWGQKGRRGAERAEIAHWRAGDALTLIGQMIGIVYRTEKGSDDEPVDYDHDFSKPYPKLYRHEASGRLVIAGGKYRVEERGIIDNGTPDNAAAAPDPHARVVLLGDLVEVRIAGRGTLRPKGTPRPRLCYHGRTGLLVVAGGKPRAL